MRSDGKSFGGGEATLLGSVLLVYAVGACTGNYAANDGNRANVPWASAQSLTAAGGGAAPVFAASPAGRLAVAWVSAPNAGTDGRLFLRPDLSEANSKAVELRDPLGSLSIYGEVPPKIAFAPNGSLYAAYLVTRVVPGMRWPQNALRFAVSKDGGVHWDAPTTVAGDSVFGSYDDHALHVTPDGTIYLSWLAEVRHDTSRTYFARSVDGGSTWSKPTVIDNERSCPCCRTAMASAPGGALYVAWRKRFPIPGGEQRDIVVAKSVDKGQTWTKPVRVHTDAWQVNYCPDAGPSVKVSPGGIVHVAWWTGKEGSAGTQYSQSTDDGMSFSAPIPLGLARYSRAAHIQLALGTGRESNAVIAVWEDGTLQTPQVVVRVSRDGGRSFAPAQTVSAAGSESAYPVVALQHDTIRVAWQERSLAAAAAESAALAKKDPADAATYVNAVGALHVVTRSGVMAGASEP